MRSKGIELLTGKTIVARGKEAKKKTESAIADPDIRKELKKNVKLLLVINIITCRQHISLCLVLTSKKLGITY
jgi:hypothetical protein